MQKGYELHPPLPDTAASELSPYPELLRELLYHRGIDTKEKANTFLNPSYESHTHDPFLIAGMGMAVERILKAIADNEHIVIWSDYDHDGIPGGVILHDFFKKIGYANFENYIPHRHTEGYGVNIAGLEKLKKEGASLIITVDCGISDIEPEFVCHSQLQTGTLRVPVRHALRRGSGVQISAGAHRAWFF